MPIVKKMSGKRQAKPRTTRKLKVDQDDLSGLSIPDLNIPSDDLSAYSIFIHGEKGIGKTELANRFPSAVTFLKEPFSRKNLRIRQIPATGEAPLTWGRLKAYLQMFSEDSLREARRRGVEGKGKVQTVIFDTVGEIFQLASDYVCFNKGIKHPNDANDYGKTWREIDQEFGVTIEAARDCGLQPIFLEHAKLKDIDAETVSARRMLIPSVSERLWKVLKASDFAFYYGYRGHTRALYIRTDDSIWTACARGDRFLEPKTDEPIAAIPAGRSADECYKNLLLAWHNKLTDVLTVKQLMAESEPEKEDESS